MIKTVIKLYDGTVFVFDDKGKELSEYQGQYGNVKERILKDAPPEAIFVHWFSYAIRPHFLSREEW